MELLTSGVFLVTLADWSEVAAQGNAVQLRVRLGQTIRMVLFIIMPVIAILLALRVPVITVMLQRGQFDANLTAATASTLALFLLGIPPDVVGRIYVRLFLVWRETKILGGLAVLKLVVTTILSLGLMRLMGVRGLALADSLAILLIPVILIALANRRLGDTLAATWIPLIKVGLTGLGSGMVAALMSQMAPAMSVWVMLPVAAALGCVAYLLIAWLLRIQELTTIFQLITSRYAGECIT
jgi:putative peptidoglycan lipid II flippase